jgi:signal transduction histidine kinase
LLYQSSTRGSSARWAGCGHGLGLAIVQAIGAAHLAGVTARARPDGGLDVKVTFPLSPPSYAGRPVQPAG